MKTLLGKLKPQKIYLGALRMGLRFKLVLLTGLVILTVSLSIILFYQVKLSDEFIKSRAVQLDGAIKFLKFYGKNHFQASTYDKEDLKLLLEPFLSDPEFRFIEIRSAANQVVFSDFSAPVFNDWLSEWKIPSVAEEQSGKFQMDGEQIVYMAIPFLGPKERAIRQEMLSIESLFGDDDFQASAQADDGQFGEEEVKVWVIVGTGAKEMLERLQIVRISSLELLIPITLLALLVTYLFVNWTVRPLLKMSAMAANISRGNFGDRVSVDTDDEIGELAQTFNRMADQLSGMFTQLQRSIDHLTQVSAKVAGSAENVQEGSLKQATAIEESSASIEEMNRSIREITRNIQFLEQSAEESTASILEMGTTISQVDEHMDFLGQSVEGTVVNITELTDLLEQVRNSIQNLQQASEETASSMHQVDSNIRHIKESTESATALSESVFEDAKTGRTAVERTRQGIEEIEKFAEHMGNVVVGLETTSEQIVKIIDVIREISDKTNLLALNAAIIAAQAGERGRGFSVVAQEIKSLSDKTSESIQEIGRLIEAVQTESRRAGDAMRQSKDAIVAGRARAEEAGKALDAILGSTEEVLERVRSIEHTTAEQSRGSHQVAISIQQVAEMVNQLAQITAAQGGQASALSDGAQKMQNIAQQVRRTTREQSAGSQLITTSIERITEMVKQIAKSLQEQQGGSDRVLESTEQIRVSAETNLKHVAQQSDVVRVLNEEILRFQRLFREFQSEEPSV